MPDRIQRLIDRMMKMNPDDVEMELRNMEDSQIKRIWSKIQAGDGPSQLSGQVEAEMTRRGLMGYESSRDGDSTLPDVRKFLHEEISAKEFMGTAESSNKVLKALEEAVDFQNGTERLESEFYQVGDTTVYQVEFLMNREEFAIKFRSKEQESEVSLRNLRLNDRVDFTKMSEDPSMDAVQTEASILISEYS